MDAVLAKVHRALERSELLRAVALSRQEGGRALTTGATPLRSLTDREVASLERGGNFADDWSHVRVAEGFDCRRVRNSSFYGDIIIGRTTGMVKICSIDQPAGIYRSTVRDCVIGHGALVSDVRLLANTLVGPGATLFDCGRIVCTSATAFGNGRALSLGLEGGGRDVPIFAEIDVEVAAAVASQRHRREFLASFADLVRTYAEAATATCNIIAAGTVVCHTSRIENVYFGPSSRIDGATQVIESTILSADDEETVVESGASVTHSVLQWGSRATTMSLVNRTVLTEFSGAEQHCKVTDTIVGPNTTIAQGEATASLVGPFVGFHHQALLIAAHWPEGKGNIAAGACIGSNHTGRAPDQEFRPGEGLFLGMGVRVKYPSDFSRSPYAVLACGVTTLPQVIAFPFALITPPADYGLPRGFNQIIPAWLLTDSMYTLARNEAKFQARNRARRTLLDAEIFRPEIIDLMCDACTRLEAVSVRKPQYTEADISGLGKNYLLDRHLTCAIAGYRLAIRFYALRCLHRRTRELLNAGRINAARYALDFPTSARWEHSRRLLRQNCGITNVLDGLAELGTLARQIAERVEHSKAKDDERGRLVIADYDDAHVPAGEDPVVRQVWSVAESLAHESTQLIERFARGMKLTRSLRSRAGTQVQVG